MLPTMSAALEYGPAQHVELRSVHYYKVSIRRTHVKSSLLASSVRCGPFLFRLQFVWKALRLLAAVHALSAP
jgi:hypothetical protein